MPLPEQFVQGDWFNIKLVVINMVATGYINEVQVIQSDISAYDTDWTEGYVGIINNQTDGSS